MRDAAGSISTVSSDFSADQEGQRTADLMREYEAAVWRIFNFNWKLLAIIAGIVVAVLVTTEFRIEPLGYVVAFALAAFYWQFGRHLNAKRWNQRVAFTLIAFGQLGVAIPT
jgi:hypothetical protein